MKKFLSVVSLLMALMMLCTSALANEQKYDEPVTVHFVRSTDDTLDANYFSQHPDKTMTDNLWCDLFRDELNINVEYDWIVKSGDEYDQKLAAELAVGAIPEFVNVTALQAKQLYEAGLIMPLDEIYNEYATEQTKRVMLETGTSPFDAVTFDGQLYALPVVGETLMIADLMWIRTDWLEKLNLPVPTTMDELIATAKAFAEADFDGNGVNDTIGMGRVQDALGSAVHAEGLLQCVRLLSRNLGGRRNGQAGVWLYAARYQGRAGDAASDVCGRSAGS